MTKKGILEKLGIVELVEEKSPETLVEQKSINEKKVVEAEVVREPLESPAADQKIVESNPMEKKVEKPIIVPQNTVSEIGEKLDVLIESYEKNKFLTIEEIYRNKNLDKDVKQTVFIAEVFMKALPDNLPIDIKKKSTVNILEASDLKKDDLLNDAYIRIDALNTVLEDTVAKTAEIRSNNEKSIRELEERIDILKRHVDERVEFEDKQTTTIEYEIQRIINIVDGIK